MATSGSHLRQPTREDWDRLRPELERLRQVENKKIKDVVDFMRDAHGLHVTDRMFRHRAKEWQIGKKRTEAEMKAVLRVLRQYEDHPLKGVEVTLRGRSISMNDVIKFFKQKRAEDVSDMPTPSPSDAPDPPGLEIKLPYSPKRASAERDSGPIRENNPLWFCADPKNIHFLPGHRSAARIEHRDAYITLNRGTEIYDWGLMHVFWLIKFAAGSVETASPALLHGQAAISASADLGDYMDWAEHKVLSSRYNPWLVSPFLAVFFEGVNEVEGTSMYRQSASQYTDDFDGSVNRIDHVISCEMHVMTGSYDRANTSFALICRYAPDLTSVLPLHIEPETSSACDIWNGIRRILGKVLEHFHNRDYRLIQRLATLLQDSHANLRSLDFNVLSEPDEKTIFQTGNLTLVTFPCDETTESQAETFFCLEIDSGLGPFNGMGFLCVVIVARNAPIKKAFFLAMPFATYKRKTTARPSLET